MKKILLLGDTGKLGTAIKEVFKDGFSICGKNTSNFNAVDFNLLSSLIESDKFDIVINTIAFIGIDQCENDNKTAYILNSLYPKKLAELSKKNDFTLVHFSTDAVFDNFKMDFYNEKDIPSPLNIYGATKYLGDCFIQAYSKKYYIFRIPILFGFTKKKEQFVEKMLLKIENGAKIIKVADDIISSPTYSIDIAYKLLSFLNNNENFGLYHIANKGSVSLHEIMKNIIKNLNLDIDIQPASYKDFPFVAIKNTYTPLNSIKTSLLRHWEDALFDYCERLKKEKLI